MLMQAKRKLPRSLSLVLAAILVLGMVLIPTNKTQAATKVSVSNYNVPSASQEIHTDTTDGDKEYQFTMPANGTLEVTYLYPSDEYVAVTLRDGYGNSHYYASSYQTERMQGNLSVREEHLFYTTLNKGQTYNLTFSKYYQGIEMIFRLRYAPNSATLKSGKLFYGGTKNNTVSYYKIKVPKNGYLHVQFQDGCKASSPSYYIRLLNAKKKPLTHSTEWISNYTSDSTDFGVKKGTYYLAVTGAGSNPVYTIKATAKAVATKAGAKKAKAVTLKRGKAQKGVVYAKNKKVAAKHWYRFVVTKRKKVVFSISTKTCLGGLRLDIKPAKGYGSYTGYFDSSKPKDAIKLYTTRNANMTLDPGVYYVCVSGYNYGNGYYALKWK